MHPASSQHQSNQRNVVVVTGSRAEFGLLRTVMQAVAAHPKLNLITFVTGSHFVTGSWRDIKQAGFHIDAKIRMQNKGEVGFCADAIAFGKGVTRLAQALNHIQTQTQKPVDYVLVLGDRIEAFAAASAASIMGIRVAHMHGGDRAEGVADEAMRHAITKLAHLHLPATKTSAKRIQKMGEDAKRIHIVGSPAVDGLDALISNQQTLTHPHTACFPCIIMHHPVGASDAQERRTMHNILKATQRLNRLIMAPNLDPGRQGILQALNDHHITPIEHLPRPEFLTKLQAAPCIIGNSSCGLIEAAVLKTMCVNIGPRQNGREKPANVIDCDATQRAIKKAVTQAITQAAQLTSNSKQSRRSIHPYGNGQTGQKTAELLAGLDLQTILTRKQNTY